MIGLSEDHNHVESKNLQLLRISDSILKYVRKNLEVRTRSFSIIDLESALLAPSILKNDALAIYSYVSPAELFFCSYFLA